MIRLIEGPHLTATNKRHLAQMIERGMTSGQSARLKYRLDPMPDSPGLFRYLIEQEERNDWGRWQTRRSRGVLQHS